MNCRAMRDNLMLKLVSEKFVTDKSGCKMVEILGASFIADGDHLFGTPNKEYIEAEIEWYMSLNRHVSKLFDIYGKEVAIWKSVADDLGLVNSNYGHCIFSDDRHNQFTKCRDSLLDDMNSRQAIMIYTTPEMHELATQNNGHDFTCTNAVQYLLREGKLHAIVQMRSNDAVFGFNNDVAWQRFVLNKLVVELNGCGYKYLEVGEIQWQVGSLHVYERHFPLMRKYDYAETQ